MQREHRVRDNWGLHAAQAQAQSRDAPLLAACCLPPALPDATIRHCGFLLRGLEPTARTLDALRIPFFLLRGDPGRELPALLARVRAGLLVTDFDPLRPKRQWLAEVLRQFSGRVVEVDSRNCVPCRMASDKREYGARTIRPKILRLLPEFLEPCPELNAHPHPWPGAVPETHWSALRAGIAVDRGVGEVEGVAPGEDAALALLDDFITTRLPAYASRRNDPNADAQSGLSPYLHFGMLSSQRVALEVLKRSQPGDANREAFLEELIVRRELADNFCLHAGAYDSVEAFPDWARKALDKHRHDPRPQVYGYEELEAARTHDELWNAAQREMLLLGRMPGYLRMYWAKKILEWSATPEEALAAAIRLNDRYQLDGGDANGYAGIAWSLGGVHDRPWPERPVFGTIRSMTLAGCRRKFNVRAYVDRVAALAGRLS